MSNNISPETQAHALSVLRGIGESIVKDPGSLYDAAVHAIGLQKAGYFSLQEVFDALHSYSQAARWDHSQALDTIQLAAENAVPLPLEQPQPVQQVQPVPQSDPIKGYFNLLDRQGINALPDLQPMIGNVLDKGTVVALAAQPAAGKSFLAIDWACSYVTGRTWQDNPIDNTVTYPGDRPYTGKVLYIAGEGGRGIKHRMGAWEQAWQKEVPEDSFILIDHPVQLGNATEVGLLCRHLEQETYGLVVVDTVARCTLGMEENSATDMGKVVDALYKIREAMGPDGTVLAIHHQGKSGTVRGSSALLGGVDQLLKLSRHGDTELILEDEKRKDNMELAPMNLTFATKFDSRVIESAGPGWTDRNELVTEMEGLRAVLPMSKTELRLATDLSEKQLFHDLARGLNAGLIKSDGAKNPRYSLSNEG